MDTAEPTVGAVIEQIGPRLRHARERRGVSLSEVAGATGFSVSTLSRLETGQRKPSLELLLPVTAAIGVTLDDVVASPRVVPTMTRRAVAREKGRVLTPVSRWPSHLRACTLIIPAHDSVAHLREHPGRIWLLVLHGRMRLVLGERELILGAGQAAELDCTSPHWFGALDGAVEVLSVYASEGERITMRTGSH